MGPRIHEGLNVVETWNSANGFIFFGKGGEVASNRLDDQEVSVHGLHLLQSCLVYANILMLQRVLAEPAWMRLGRWLAEQFMKSDVGLLMNIVLGIVGAAIASAILSFFGIVPGGWIGYLIAGFIGACLLIWIVRAVRGRTA